MLLRGGLTSLLVLAGVVVACSAPEKADKVCTPDANVFCRCEDRKEGTKKCKADGQTFEACVPCDGSGSAPPGGGGADGLGSRQSDAPTSPPSGANTESNPDPPTDTKTPTKDTSTSTTSPNPTTPTEDDTPKPKPPSTTGSTTTSSGSSSSTKPTPDGTASFPDTPHCKPLTNGAPKIEAQELADVATEPVGGKAKDGLYYQAWVIKFTGEDGTSGPTGHYSQQTLELMGDVGRYVFSDDQGQTGAGGFRLTPLEGKNKVTVAYECPAAAPKDLAYDATDSTLVLYDPPYARVFYLQKGGAK
jgi:hypothetical protein